MGLASARRSSACEDGVRVGMHHVRVCSALAEFSRVVLQGLHLHPREAGCLQLSEAGLLSVPPGSSLLWR